MHTRCTSDVTLVLPWCMLGAPRTSPWCITGAHERHLGRHRGAPRMHTRCTSGITVVHQGSIRDTPRCPQGCTSMGTVVHHGCTRDAPLASPWCITDAQETHLLHHRGASRMHKTCTSMGTVVHQGSIRDTPRCPQGCCSMGTVVHHGHPPAAPRMAQGCASPPARHIPFDGRGAPLTADGMHLDATWTRASRPKGTARAREGCVPLASACNPLRNPRGSRTPSRSAHSRGEEHPLRSGEFSLRKSETAMMRMGGDPCVQGTMP
jgi:hypothetical protein